MLINHIIKSQRRKVVTDMAVFLSLVAFVGIISLVVYSAASLANAMDIYDQEARLFLSSNE
jgi:hypothetical protein